MKTTNKNNNKRKVSKPLYLNIHSMPITSAQSFKLWYVMGGIVLILLVAIFFLFLI